MSTHIECHLGDQYIFTIVLTIFYSVKYLAFYSCCLCSALLLRDLWHRLSDRSVKGLTLFAEFVVQSATITIVPTVIYVSMFYIHLAILTKAGVHDALMTSAFQVS